MEGGKHAPDRDGMKYRVVKDRNDARDIGSTKEECKMPME